MNTTRLIDTLRGWPWLVAALVATGIVGWLAPHQIGLLVWALSKLALGAYLGYWIDRSVFAYARPGDLFRLAGFNGAAGADDLKVELLLQAGKAALRRAVVMSAAILALGLGV